MSGLILPLVKLKLIGLDTSGLILPLVKMKLIGLDTSGLNITFSKVEADWLRQIGFKYYL